MEDLEELKKLSPEERVKKLRVIEEKSRKEIEDARKLMTDSLREIEIGDKIKRDIPIPQLTSVDVDTLFGSEEKEMFRTKRYGQAKTAKETETHSLEESITKENPKDLPPEAARQYAVQLDQISSRLEQFKSMDQDHFQQYQKDYQEEISSMYNSIKQMQHYAGISDQVEKMHLSEQISEINSMFSYKRGGI